MSTIRLRYTGLVNFASQLFTILTGFLFVVTVTRNLITTEFGVWQNIGDVINYMTILAGVVPFSMIRYVARGQQGAAMTGFVANMVISIPVSIAFLLLAPFLASAIGASTLSFQVASIQILLFYILQVLEGIVLAKVPHLLGYGVVIRELTKIVLGIVFVVYLGMGLLGAILVVATSQVALSLFYLISIRTYLREGVKWDYLRSWLSMSFISLYGVAGDRLGTLGLILLIITWGSIARAYVGAAVIIAVIISYSKALATALYPRLLAKTDPEAAEMVLKLTSLFAIPMTGGIIVLSKPLLTVLKPEYEIVSAVLSVYAVAYLLESFSAVFDKIIMATEQIDKDSQVTLKSVVKSKLFVVPTLSYVYACLFLGLQTILLKSFSMDPLQAAFYTSIACIIANLPLFLLRYRLAKKSLSFKLPIRNIIKHVLATILMMFVLSQISFVAKLSRILILVIVGATIYFGIVVTIEAETRALFASAISLVRRRIRK